MFQNNCCFWMFSDNAVLAFGSTVANCTSLPHCLYQVLRFLALVYIYVCFFLCVVE